MFSGLVAETGRIVKVTQDGEPIELHEVDEIVQQ